MSSPSVLSTLLRPVLCASLYAALHAAASAQSFQYTDFSSIAGLALNADAAQAGSVLRVTPAAGDQHGSVWYDQLVSVGNGFDTTFRFQVTGLSGTGADGMAFLIQNDPRGTTALGETLFGTPLSYGADPSSPAGTAIANSIAIEIDTWISGPPTNDSSANEISIHTRGMADNSHEEAFSLGRTTPATDMSDGLVHAMRIAYSNGQLDVYLDDLTNPILSVFYDLLTGGNYVGGAPVGGLGLVGNEFAWVGFTGATGGAWENHDVITWSFDASSLGQSYCGPGIPNSTGLSGVISASGSANVAANDLTLTADDLPPGQFGYFLVGQTQGFFNPPGSNGIICLMGNIGRYNQVQNIISGPTGSIMVNLASVPVNPPAPVQPGQTWNFQCWYRDIGPTNNFTDGVSILFN